MPERASEHSTHESEPDGSAPYEAPLVEDLETLDGLAVTAAGVSAA